MDICYYIRYNKAPLENCNIIFSKKLYKKIASNTLAQIGSKAVTAVISIFLIGILTKHLWVELYGSYNKVYNYLGIFAFLADLGLYAIMIREISLGKVGAEKIVGNVLTLRTILWIWIIFGALWIAVFLPGLGDPLTLGAIFIVWIFTLVSLVNSAILALMQSQMKMEFSFISLVVGKLLNIFLVIFFLVYLFGNGPENTAFLSVFIAGLLWVVLNTYLNYLYARKFVSIKYLFDREYITHIFKISLPYGLALFLSVVYFKIDIFLLPFFENSSLADRSIGLYSLPMKIVEVLMVVGGFYLNSLLPSLSEKFEEKKYNEISQILAVSIQVLLAFWLLIATLWNLFGAETIRIIATPEFLTPAWHNYNSLQAMRIVLWVLVFHFIALAFIYILIASGRQKVLLMVNGTIVLVNIVGNIIFIPFYSFVGAAGVTLFSQALLMCVVGVIVLRTIPLPLKYIKSYVLSIIFTLGIYFLFQNLLAWVDLWDIMTIVLIAPIFTGIFIVWQYFLIKAYFNFGK